MWRRRGTDTISAVYSDIDNDMTRVWRGDAAVVTVISQAAVPRFIFVGRGKDVAQTRYRYTVSVPQASKIPLKCNLFKMFSLNKFLNIIKPLILWKP